MTEISDRIQAARDSIKASEALLEAERLNLAGLPAGPVRALCKQRIRTIQAALETEQAYWKSLLRAAAKENPPF